MPAILRRLPLYDHFTAAQVRGPAYRIFPLQIIVWVSIGPKGQERLDPQTARFPAVFDTAFTDNFLIHEQQLRHFAGLQPEHLRRLSEPLRAHGWEIPLHAANVWIHCNKPGERDQLADASPFLLELHRGIGVSAGPDVSPRLPLLGARALRRAELQVFLDYHAGCVSARTARKFWIFG